MYGQSFSIVDVYVDPYMILQICCHLNILILRNKIYTDQKCPHLLCAC